MFNYLEKIREKSENHRRSFAFGLSMAITAVIFTVWISVKFSVFSNDFVATKNSLQEEVITPVASFSKLTASALEGIKGSIDGLKTSIDNLGNNIKIYTKEQ
jgi:hypothetical protein